MLCCTEVLLSPPPPVCSFTSVFTVLAVKVVLSSLFRSQMPAWENMDLFAGNRLSRLLKLRGQEGGKGFYMLTFGFTCLHSCCTLCAWLFAEQHKGGSWCWGDFTVKFGYWARQWKAGTHKGKREASTCQFRCNVSEDEGVASGR